MFRTIAYVLVVAVSINSMVEFAHPAECYLRPVATGVVYPAPQESEPFFERGPLEVSHEVSVIGPDSAAEEKSPKRLTQTKPTLWFIANPAVKLRNLIRSFYKTIIFYSAIAVVVGILLYVFLGIIPEKPMGECLDFIRLPQWLWPLDAVLWAIPLNGFLSFLTFVPLGDVLGQIIHSRQTKILGEQPKPFILNKTKNAFLLTLFLFAWFWPVTFILWKSSLPHYLLGCADQITVAPFCAPLVFLLDGLIENRSVDYKTKYNERSIVMAILKEKLPDLLSCLRFLFFYWAPTYGLIFWLAPESWQLILVGAMEPASVIVTFFLAKNVAKESRRVKIKDWAKTLMIAAFFYNFLFFPRLILISRHVGIPALFAGVAMYVSIIFRGFEEEKGEPPSADNIKFVPAGEPPYKRVLPNSAGAIQGTVAEELTASLIKASPAGEGEKPTPGWADEDFGLSSIDEVSVKHHKDILQEIKPEIITKLKESKIARYTLIIHTEIKAEDRKKVFKHEVFELSSDSGEIKIRAVVWRDALPYIIQDPVSVQGLSFLQNLSDTMNVPIIEPDKPIILSESELVKTWGVEIPFTMIEERYVAEVTDTSGTKKSKLPDVLKLFPDDFAIDAKGNLVLLKILRPGSEKTISDLYLEVHWEKYELYLVTGIDKDAWPDEIGRVVCGLNEQLVKEYKQRYRQDWQPRYKEDFRRACDRYKQEIYEQYIAKDLTPPEGLEAQLREEVYRFTGYKDVRVGDVLVFPKGTVHSLRHGIEVAEVLSFHYERGIIVPTLKPVTSSKGEWFTDKAFSVMDMAPYKTPKFVIVSDAKDRYTVENLAVFPLNKQQFVTQRVKIKNNASFRDSTISSNGQSSYHIVMSIDAPLEITFGNGAKIDLGIKKACIIPASAGDYTIKTLSDNGQAVFLKIYTQPADSGLSAPAQPLTAVNPIDTSVIDIAIAASS